MTADELGLVLAGAMVGVALGATAMAILCCRVAGRDPLSETIDDKQRQIWRERRENARAQKFFAREDGNSESPTQSEPGREPTPGISPTVRLVP